MAADSLGWFDADGKLATAFPDYRSRNQQQEMVAAVADAIDQRRHLVVEAGTGIGKSLAYLLPALLSGKKVLISTGTRNLQEQLFHKDLPQLTRLLELPRRVSLLKGRSNYLCQHRLELTQNEGRLTQRSQVRQLRDIRSWSTQTSSGDLAEIGDTGDGSALWRMVSSTTDNCLGNDCAFYDDCFVLKARRKAQEADLVIINHHLLLADMALKDAGFGEILPAFDAIIIDEAHQLPGTAAQFFGQRLSFFQVNDLLHDVRAAMRSLGDDMPDLDACLTQAGRSAEQLLVRLAGPTQRADWASLQRDQGFQQALGQFGDELRQVSTWLDKTSERSKELAGCHERATAMLLVLTQISDDDPEQVRWLERNPRNFTLHVTPLDISGAFHAYRDACHAAWIMTSATLSVNNQFAHFTEQLGMQDARTLALQSPFDYPKHAVLYAPEDMPDPNQPGFSQALIDKALPVIQASGGGAFVLCTSLRAVDEISEQLKARLDMHVLAQGEDSRSRLLESFSRDGNAVLVATSSFWEGVDVRGPALRLVIIDRLPFTPPDDPVLQSREKAISEAGGNAFMQLQLPQAVLSLKQGVGRLIRSETDRGVVMICDPRLRSRPYGRLFLNSLPAMTRTSQFAVVERFFGLQNAAGQGEA